MNYVISSPAKTKQQVADMLKSTTNQKSVQKRISDLQNDLKYYESTNKKLTEQLNEQGERLSKEKQKMQTLQMSQSKVQTQKDLQIERLIDENQKLVKAYKRLEAEKNKPSRNNNETQDLRKQIESQQQEIEELKSKLSTDNYQSSGALGVLAAKRAQQILLLTNENQDLKEKQTDLQEKLENLLRENLQLQEIIYTQQSENPSQRQMSEVSSTKNQEKYQQYLNEQITQLTQDLKDAKQTIQKLQKQSISKQTSNKPNSNQKPSNSYEKLPKNQYYNEDDKDKKIKELLEQIKMLEFERDNIIQNVKLECAQDMKRLSDKLKEEFEIKSQIDREQGRGQDKATQEMIQQLNSDNQRLQIQVSRQDKEMKSLEKKLTDLLISQQDIQKSLQKEKQFQDYLRQEKSNLQEELKQKQNEIGELKEEIIKLAQDRQQLRDQSERNKYDLKGSQSQSSNKPISEKSRKFY